VLAGERVNSFVNAPAVMLGVEFAYIMRQIGEFGGQPERAASERSLYPFAFSLTEEAGIITRMQAKQRMVERQLVNTGHPPSGPPSDFVASDLVGL
jgi:hypothetical protein